MAEVKRRTLSREDARVQMVYKVQVVFLSPERCFVTTARLGTEMNFERYSDCISVPIPFFFFFSTIVVSKCMKTTTVIEMDLRIRRRCPPVLETSYNPTDPDQFLVFSNE